MEAYALVRRGPATFVDRFDGRRVTASILVPEPATEITGIGKDVVVLTETRVLKFRHDPADVF